MGCYLDTYLLYIAHILIVIKLFVVGLRCYLNTKDVI